MLLALERNMVDMDVINEIFRAAHTLKGMAGTMGFTQMIPHPPAHHHRAVMQWKSRLEKASKGTRPLQSADMNLLFTGLGNLQAMADSIRGGGNDAHIDVSEMVAQLRNKAPMPAEATPALTLRHKSTSRANLLCSRC